MLLASRWLLAPLYMILCLILILIGLKAGQEGWHLAMHLFSGSDADLILGILSIIDMVLVGNLLVMVALSGYVSFVSPLDTVGNQEKPAWLGKLDPATIKMKLSASIVVISGIWLLKAYMSGKQFDNQTLMTAAGVHLIFVISTLILAFVDRIAFSAHREHDEA